MKVCCTCKEEKEIELFGNNKRNKDGKQRQCKECQAKKDNRHYLENPESYKATRRSVKEKRVKLFEELKKQMHCEKCGETRHYVLDFHHKDPATKTSTVSDLKHRSLKSLKEEIEKCIVLCANCHREVHYLETL